MRVPKRAMGTVLEFSENVAESFRIDCRDEAGQVATADRGRPNGVSLREGSSKNTRYKRTA